MPRRSAASGGIFGLTVAPPDLYAFLDARGIGYTRYDHPAVYTVEESGRLVPEMAATPTMNLFLRDEKGRRHFLVSIVASKQVDLRRLAPVLGTDKLSFGSPERLRKHLGVEPGAVTLLALVNDPAHAVEVFLDQDLWTSDAVRCHPLVNTATLAVPREGLERFLEATGHRYRVIEVPQRMGD